MSVEVVVQSVGCFTRNLTGLVSEHETTDGSNQTEEDGQKRDLGLWLNWKFRHAIWVGLLQLGGVGGLALLLLVEETHDGRRMKRDNGLWVRCDELTDTGEEWPDEEKGCWRMRESGCYYRCGVL